MGVLRFKARICLFGDAGIEQNYNEDRQTVSYRSATCDVD